MNIQRVISFIPQLINRPQVSEEMLNKLREDLLSEAELNTNFLVLMVSSCIIATLGLLMNSAAVIIGAMIIAPLMMPLRGLALGALDAQINLLISSLKTLAIGTIFAVLMSGLVGFIFSLPAASFGTEILARTQPNLADLGVALAAGGVSAFAKIRPRISDALAGTAIAVALMPPLCVVGIGLSQADWGTSGGAFLLYLTNFLGITLACILVFIWGGYALDYSRKRRALIWFASLTGLLILPLFLSLANLIQQKQLEAIIKANLQQRTITFGQQTELINIRVNWSYPWSRKPSKLTLFVRAIPEKDNVTPEQVRRVEEFLQQKLSKKFQITVLIVPFLKVTGDETQGIPIQGEILNP